MVEGGGAGGITRRQVTSGWGPSGSLLAEQTAQQRKYNTTRQCQVTCRIHSRSKCYATD